MASYVRLCEIIRMVQHLHNHHDSTPSRDLKAAHGIRQALKDFAAMVKEDLGFAIGGEPVVETQERFVEQVVMSYRELPLSISCYWQWRADTRQSTTTRKS